MDLGLQIGCAQIFSEKVSHFIVLFRLQLRILDQGWQTLIGVNQENRPFRCTK
jgi:hypothetical protein